MTEAYPTVAGPPRPSCVRAPCIYLLVNTCWSKGSKTELANGARKADRKPPLCPSPTCGCSNRRLLLAAGVRLLANARNFVLYLFNRCLCKAVNGMFFVSMLYAHSASAHSRSASALAMIAFLILLFLTLARACMHTMCLFTRVDMMRMKRLSTHSVVLYLRQVHVLNTVVWKDGRTQTHVLGRVLFEIDQ